VRGVDLVPKGHTRIQTGFRYPDGSAIDLFLAKPAGLLADVEDLRITDFGNTISWLGFLGIDPFKPGRRRKLLEDICETYEVTENGTALELRVPPDRLEEAIVRLSQACIRIADISYMLRQAGRSQFSETVEELLDEAALAFESQAIIDHQGRSHKVDFYIHGRRAQSALMLLPNQAYSHIARQRAEHVFTVFFDLREWPGQRVAALEDGAKNYSEPDLERIEKFGPIIPVSDRDSLVSILEAA
jgi:hypothetical protein